jgi:hypothetical protein
MESFVFDLVHKPMDLEAYDNWREMTVEQRLPYIIDDFQIADVGHEYQDFLDQNKDKSIQNGEIIESMLVNSLSEFQTVETISSFFIVCDTNENGSIDFVEYIICRAAHDRNGDPSDVNEFDMLENVLLDDYRTNFLDNPNVRSPRYKYDVNGMIVD